jgi:hypothetical protein
MAVIRRLVCANTPNLALVTRLRWDASLYHDAPKRTKGQRGKTPEKGDRQRSPEQVVNRKDTAWGESEVSWYGGQKKKLLLHTHTALWHTAGERPVKIRYVITRDPEGKLRDEVFATTRLDATPAQILE